MMLSLILCLCFCWITGYAASGPRYSQSGEASSFPKNIASTSSLGIKNSEFTMMAWVKRTGNSNEQTIFGTDTRKTNKGLHLVLRRQKYYMGFYSNDCGASTVNQKNRWEHVAFVYQNSQQ